jgi:predicted O-methyltransferase YrrM
VADARWENDPFGTSLHASREEYLTWFRQARSVPCPELDELEAALGFAVEGDWLDELALHTQIVKKKTSLSYVHGRLLYALLRRMIADCELDFVTVLETGTARGFSALCMAKALADSSIDGRIVTIDVLSHLKRQIWNCIDDHDGPKSRAEILAPWRGLTRNIVFLQGDTLSSLPRVGLERINFAFLDAQHTERSVMREFNLVSERQQVGDMLVFDDCTELLFPGVVKAVTNIESRRDYVVKRLGVSDQRGYAWATRVA